jgi:WD40 repeat protein
VARVAARDRRARVPGSRFANQRIPRVPGVGRRLADSLSMSSSGESVHNEFSGVADVVVQAGVIHGDVVLGAGSRPGSVAPAMAPAVPSWFVHRVALEDRLAETLLRGERGERGVMLAGAGGYGKTTLAAWVCRQPKIRDQFPGGVLWVELGQRPGPERITRALAELTAAIGGREGKFANVLSAADAFRVAAAGRRILLVVDDVWNAVDLEAFRDLGEQITLLVTSRRTNVLDGTEVLVDGLSDDEAAAMLGQGRGDDATLMRLLRRAGRWPLALVMLSGILRSLIDRHAVSGEEAVTALIEELDEHGIAALDEMSDADVLRNLSQTLELSLAELVTAGGAECRDRFAELAAFPAGEVIPYWLLRQLWGMSDVRVRTEGDRFVGRSLATAPHADGLRLHDVTREAMRRNEPERMAAVSARLLNAIRPPDGWHRLPDGERSFADGLAHHLRQAGQLEELGDLLRDARFLTARLARSGPTALEADLNVYAADHPGDVYPQELTGLMRREGHLFTDPLLSAGDIGVIFRSRLPGRAVLEHQVRHTEQVLPGLVPLHPMPDRDDGALVRSLGARSRGSCNDIAWHPDGELLATVGYDPQLLIMTPDGARVRSVELSGAVFEAARWSPDGTMLAAIGRTDRFRASNDDEDVCTLMLYDPTTGAELAATSIRGRRYPEVPRFCWSPDSALLAVAGADGVLLWDPSDSDTLVRHAAGDVDHCDSLDWHPRHGLLAYRCTNAGRRGIDGELLLWPDPGESEHLDIWHDPVFQGSGADLAWRPGGRTAALRTPGGLLVVDPFSGEIRWRRKQHLYGFRWSPGGGQLALLHGSRHQSRIELLAVPSDGELGRTAHPAIMMELDLGTDYNVKDSLAWSPDGSTVATTASDKSVIKIWHVEQTGRRSSGRKPARSFSYVRWTADDRDIAVRRVDGEWLALDPCDQTADPKAITVPFPAGRDPAYRSRWLREVGVPEAVILEHAGMFAEFAPDDQSYVLGDWFQPLRLFVKDGTPLADLTLEASQRWHAACFTPSGGRLVTISSDDSWEKLTIAAWALTGTMREHPVSRWTMDDILGPGPSIGHVSCITASETHVAVIAEPFIGLFELPDLRHVCWIKTNGSVRDAAFDGRGERLAVLGDAGVYLFGLTGQNLWIVSASDLANSSGRSSYEW